MISFRLLLSALFTALLFTGCADCGCDIIHGVDNPTDETWVVVYDCGCGATTEQVRRVAIRAKGTVPDDPRDSDGLVCMLEQGTSVTATWSNNQAVVVKTSLSSVVNNQKFDKVDKYQVEYIDIIKRQGE